MRAVYRWTLSRSNKGLARRYFCASSLFLELPSTRFALGTAEVVLPSVLDVALGVWGWTGFGLGSWLLEVGRTGLAGRGWLDGLGVWLDRPGVWLDGRGLWGVGFHGNGDRHHDEDRSGKVAAGGREAPRVALDDPLCTGWAPREGSCSADPVRRGAEGARCLGDDEGTRKEGMNDMPDEVDSSGKRVCCKCNALKLVRRYEEILRARRQARLRMGYL